MFDFTSQQFAGPVKLALILDDDITAREALRHTLATLGYEARFATDVDAALDALRTSTDTVALFFDVEAYEETLDGRGYASLIGSLLEDSTLAHQHLFAAISSTPDDVEWTLGKALARLNAPIFSKPCAADTIEAYLAAARGQPLSEPLLQTAPTF